jgi:dephospho-CoA kinase
MIIGLTGGIGSGKSIAGKYFNELGIDTIDADNVAKNILDDNKKATKLFLKNFGDEFLDANNKIKRDLLRTKIFKDIEKKNKLESIIHPIVREGITKFIEKSDSIYKIIMVPLIFETNSQDFYDKIIIIDCDESIQIERASQRDNKSKEDIINIIKNQASREERRSIADYVILNNSTLDNLKVNILRIHQKLLGIKI